MKDEVRIKGLRLRCRIGVPEEERADFQEIKMDLAFTPSAGFPKNDDFSGAVDYAEVVMRVEELAAAGECLLVETLAQKVAEMLLREFPLESVRVVLKKFILPQTEWVGVAIERSRENTDSF